MHIELSPALHVAGAFHTVHHALHIYARGNHYPVADHHGKSRRQVDAIAGLGAPGIDGTAQLEQDFGSGGDGVGLLRGCGRDGIDRRGRRGGYGGSGCFRRNGLLGWRRTGGRGKQSQGNCDRHSFEHTHTILRESVTTIDDSLASKDSFFRNEPAKNAPVSLRWKPIRATMQDSDGAKPLSTNTLPGR